MLKIIIKFIFISFLFLWIILILFWLGSIIINNSWILPLFLSEWFNRIQYELDVPEKLSITLFQFINTISIIITLLWVLYLFFCKNFYKKFILFSENFKAFLSYKKIFYIIILLLLCIISIQIILFFMISIANVHFWWYFYFQSNESIFYLTEWFVNSQEFQRDILREVWISPRIITYENILNFYFILYSILLWIFWSYLLLNILFLYVLNYIFILLDKYIINKLLNNRKLLDKLIDKLLNNKYLSNNKYILNKIRMYKEYILNKKDNWDNNEL